MINHWWKGFENALHKPGRSNGMDRGKPILKEKGTLKSVPFSFWIFVILSSRNNILSCFTS